MIHATRQKPPRPTGTEISAAAFAAGTHGASFATVCDGCRKWVGGIYYVVTANKKRLCAACADEIGQGPASDAARAAAAAARRYKVAHAILNTEVHG